MTLDDFLAKAPRRQPKRGETGVPSPRLDFCDLKLSGSKVHIVDPSYAPIESEGCLVKLKRGTYAIQCQVMAFGADLRIAGLRMVLPGSKPERGDLICQTGTDTGKIAVYDYDAVSQVWRDEDNASLNILKEAMQGGRKNGVAVLDDKSGAVACMVRSGFGDGTFDVHELKDGNVRAGFEVTFISPDTK